MSIFSAKINTQYTVKLYLLKIILIGRKLENNVCNKGIIKENNKQSRYSKCPKTRPPKSGFTLNLDAQKSRIQTFSGHLGKIALV